MIKLLPRVCNTNDCRNSSAIIVLARIYSVRVATEAEMLISDQSQKTIDDGRQHSRVTKSPKLNETTTTRTNDASLLTYSTTASGDDKSVSPSSGRLRTSPRGEVSLCIH